MGRGLSWAPLRLAAMMALALAAGELLEIFVFATLPEFSAGVEALLDALLLTLVATPFLYFLLIRPISVEIERRRAAETDLRAANRELNEVNQSLERRVEQRTADLAATNKRLSKEIEEKRRAIDEAWKSHGFSQTVVESVPYLVIIYDAGQRRCAFVNGRVMDLLGYTPELVCSERTDFLHDVLDAEAYGALLKLGQKAVDREDLGGETFEWRMRTSAGTHRRLEVRASVLTQSTRDGSADLLLTAIEV